MDPLLKIYYFGKYFANGPRCDPSVVELHIVGVWAVGGGLHSPTAFLVNHKFYFQ